MTDSAQTGEASAERIDLGTDLTEVMRMNGWFDALSARRHLPARLSGAVKLCLNEAVTNVLSYGFEGSEAPKVGAVTVTLDLGSAAVRAVIRDNGRAFDPLAMARPEKPADIASAEIGGLGINLIRDTADAAAYARRDGWNELTLHFDAAGG